MNKCNQASIFALSAIFLLLGACAGEPDEETQVVRPVRATKVADGSVLSGRTFPGRAKAAQEVDLSFRVGGQLMVLANDIVGRDYKQGELVARIDPRDYEVELENTQGQLARAEAALARAENDYARVLRIAQEDPGATSQAMIDNMLGTRDSSAAEVRTLQASVQAAQDRLDYTSLHAPFDGTVVSQYVQNFEHVVAQQSIVRVLDDSSIEMIVNIPENMISNLPYIENIRVRFDAFPDHEIPARIKEVGTEASQTTRTYPVNFSMEQPEGIKILPGMAGRASADNKMLEQTGETVIWLPISAVFSPKDDSQSHVWVVAPDSMTVGSREVSVGDLTEAGVSVRDGLTPGEWVVTAGVSYLQEGQKVRLLEDEES